MGQVYPIVRGTVPLLVTLSGFAITGDKLTLYEIAGVALVAAGITTLALGKGPVSTSSALFALATGAIIAAYATVDSIGVRQAAQSGAYRAWVLVLYGAFLPATFLALRHRLVVDFRTRDAWKALGGGLVAMIAYGVIVAAFASDQLARLQRCGKRVLYSQL